MERGAWWATVHGVARVRHDLATKPFLLRVTQMSLWLVFWYRVLLNVKNVVVSHLQDTCPPLSATRLLHCSATYCPRQSTKEWPLPPTRLTFPVERALPQTLLSLFWEGDFTFPSCHFHFSIFKTHASLSFLSGRNYMLNLVGFSFYSLPYMFMAWKCSATSFTFHRWEIHRLRKHSGFLWENNIFLLIQGLGY